MASASDIAARVRAALGYANIQVKEAGERVGISTSTMARIVSPTNPRGANTDELQAISDATGVPLDFLRHGFENGTEVPYEEWLEERLAVFKQEVAADLDRLREELAETDLTALEAEAEAQPTTGRADESAGGESSPPG